MRYALVLLAACGGGGGASVEQMAHSKALACALDKQANEMFLIEHVAGDAPPKVLRAIGLAYHERGKTGLAGEVAKALADRGAKADADALLDLPELAALPDDADISIGATVGEVRLRNGRHTTPGRDDRALIEIRAQALGGDVAGAAARFDALHLPQVAQFDTVPYVTALAALGRDSDAAAAFANAPPGFEYHVAEGLAEVALANGHDIPGAIDRLIATRARKGTFDDNDSIVVNDLGNLARATGHEGALAPLRAAIIADVAATPGEDADRIALALADGASADERVALEPALARIPMDDYRRGVLTAEIALHGDTLDDALAALENLSVDEPELWLRLWMRHAAAGLDSGFEARMIDACRPAS